MDEETAIKVVEQVIFREVQSHNQRVEQLGQPPYNVELGALNIVLATAKKNIRLAAVQGVLLEAKK